MPEETIVMYGADWCGDCRRAKRFFDEREINYRYVDITQDKEGRSLVLEINNGMRIIPTIVFPDGSVLVEPSNPELTRKLGSYSPI